MKAVATGYEANDIGGFLPTFDIFVDERKIGELTGGYPYATVGEALDAGNRAVEYVSAKGCFPNLCAHF